jgi:hypothetical protein
VAYGRLWWLNWKFFRPMGDNCVKSLVYVLILAVAARCA